MRIESFESEAFLQELEEAWNNLKPLYDQLHGYVRHNLHKFYGCKIVDKSGPIPAHLLGNMWAENWQNILDLVQPFPNKPNIEVTKEMKKQNWTPKMMFKKAEELFISLGFEKMTQVLNIILQNYTITHLQLRIN